MEKKLRKASVLTAERKKRETEMITFGRRSDHAMLARVTESIELAHTNRKSYTYCFYRDEMSSWVIQKLHDAGYRVILQENSKQKIEWD